MKRKSILTIILIVLVLFLSGRYETKEERRFERFEQCMIENGFDYTDALCEYCWEQVK